MGIIEVDGRPKSIRTEDEEEQLLLDDINRLPEDERRALIEVYYELVDGNVDAYNSIAKAEYEVAPVSIREFLTNSYFLGETGASLWPVLADDIVELFEGGYEEACLGGSLAMDSIVIGADGSLKTLAERVGCASKVMTAQDDGTIVSSVADETVMSGVKSVVRLTLANGMALTLTPDHGVRVWKDGRYDWVEAGELVAGDLVVVVRNYSTEPSSFISDNEAMLMAYWVANGSVSEKRARFCDGNPKTSEEVIELLGWLGFRGKRYKKDSSDKCWEVMVRKTKTSGFWEWAKANELDRETKNVIVPDLVCRASNKIISVFINRLWACEGTVTYSESNKISPSFVLAMASEVFIRQVQLLLLRFGVMSRVYYVVHKGHGKECHCWHLAVGGVDNLSAFLWSFGDILGKEDKCKSIRGYCKRKKGNTNVDCLPVTWGWLNDYMVSNNLKRGKRWFGLLTDRGCRVSRKMFSRWVNEYGETEAGLSLVEMFGEGVGFEPVKSVEKLEDKVETGDVTNVKAGTRFIGNGVSVRNSLGWGKSLMISSTYVDSESGELTHINHGIGKEPIVPSFDGVNISERKANKVWKSGYKNCVKMTLVSGQWLEASLDHPVLCSSGYIEIRQLKRGDLVGVARRVPAPKKVLEISDDEVLVAVALIAERVPPKFFGLCDRQLALFMRWMFAGGNVYCGSSRKIEICLASEGLIDDIQYLLRRFGIVARKSYQRKESRGEFFDAWRLRIADTTNQILFCDYIGLIPGKEEACKELELQARFVESDSNWDVVPITNVELREIRLETEFYDDDAWKKLAGQLDGAFMGVQQFRELCEATGYAGRYRRFVDMADDIVWERVESIIDIGYHDVYDLSVPDTNNAVVNGIVIHNSFFATTAMAYVIYQMSCLRNPQRAYGIDMGSQIYVAMISVTEKVARRVVINELIGKIQHSRYFQDHFNPKQAPSILEVRFPKGIQVVAGSTGSSATIGLNIFSGLIDECVAGWTKILTPHGYRTIEELYDGDCTITPIMAYSERDEELVCSQGQIKRATNTMVFEVELSNGAVVTATFEHPFLVRGHGYVPLNKLHIWDQVVVVDAEKIQSKKVVSIRSAGSCQTFDVMSIPYGNFIAEGVVVHNTSFLGQSKKVDRHGREMVVDMGETIYKSIIRRMKSRFQRIGRLPGVLILASSKERPSAFIEKRVLLAKEKDDPMIFIREYATWNVHPKEKFSGKFFKIVVGNERIASRILTGDEEEEKKYRDLGLQIVSVPEDYRNDFSSDIDGALRDVAGVATDVISQYMNRTEKVYECQDVLLEHPIGDEGVGLIEEWVANRPLPIMWHRIAESYTRRLPGGYEEEAWRPLRHPGAVRFAHIDTSYAGDCSGICIAHIAGWTEVVRRDARGEEYNELAPRIEADLTLRIVPPPGDEIMIADLRGIVYQFVSHGFQVAYVSLDSFQSIETIQQLKKHGIDAEVISVDRTTEPYDCLKSAMYEDRFRMAQNSVALREFRYLQRVPKPGGKIKIDHPKKNPDGTPGSKDVADSIAGVVYALTQKVPGRPMAPMMSSRESMDERQDDSWVTSGKILVQSIKSVDGSSSVVGVKSGNGSRSSLPFIRG